MPRLLFTFTGGTGHFLPLVPFARAAADSGHTVAFAAQAGALRAVEAAGFAGFDTGGRTLLESSERIPLLEVDLERERAAVRDSFAGRIARERAQALRALCADWRPDLLVSDEMDFGAPVAAEAHGVPHASVVTIGSGSFVWPELVREPLAALRAEHGLPPDPELAMLHRHLVLSSFPPSFRDPASPPPPNLHAFRFAPAGGAADPSDLEWLAARDGRPLVLFTLGTIFNLESGDLFERALAGLRELPANVLVTVGRELDPAVLGPQPPHVRVRGFVPQSLVLPHCDLCVSHGGSGSVLGALAHGVPLVLLPMGADQPLNAARCEALGVARVLDAVRATPEEVRETAAAVLADPVPRAAAERMRAELAALPPPVAAVPLLERLAAPEFRNS